MSQSYQISRLNKGLEYYSATYHHQMQKSLSKRDASIKSAVIKFLNEQNFIYDPSKASFIREKVFSLSSKQLDVILGVWNHLRSSKKIPKNTPQRFEIEGVGSITIIKGPGKMLCIHQQEVGSKGCEKRGLSQHVALGIEKKTVRFFKETHQLQPQKAQQKSFTTANKVSYFCRPIVHKAHYGISCLLEKKWIPINLQDLLQWRSRYGAVKQGLSFESELFIVASTSNYLGFLSLFNSSQNGFRMQDIKLALPQKALQSYGAKDSLGKRSPSDLLAKIETVMVGHTDNYPANPALICKDLTSLHHLFTSLITHSPHYFSQDASTKELVEQFLAWMLDLKQDIQELETLYPEGLIYKSLQLLYDHLAEIDNWSEDLEGFIENFFKKHLELIDTNHSISELMSRLNLLNLN